MQPAAAAKTPSDGHHYPFQVRGSLQTMLSLRLIAPGDPDFFPLLLDKIAHSPEFFRDVPVVLDVAPIADTAPIDLADFVGRLRSHRLIPVGIQNGTPAWNEAGAQVGLARFGTGGLATERQVQRPPPTAGRQAPAARRGAGQVIHEPVRGGQQVHAPDGDLVVLGSVGHGAEVAAAGHIHIYGPLRGRAFAGTDGDERAMIFCDQLDAELISIAGVYLVNEAIDTRLINRRVRVVCDGERLVLSPVP